MIGPNCDFQFTVENFTPGDTDLSNLIGVDTNDAAVLEFDFVPTNPTIRFQYVFASDEYEDFVFDFNDVFAFFVNGNNVALIPETNTLVSINTVNNGNDGLGDHPEFAAIPPVNPQFYVNNNIDVFPVPPIDTEMDGMTVVLTASAAVNPGVTNHIKLAIADAIDESLDSNVFIKAGSLSSSTVSLAPTGFAFPTTNKGAQSAPQTVTLSNVGSAPLTGVSISPSSNDFTLSNNNCGTTVAVGASCTISVSFSPQSGGLIQGTLNFTDSAGDSPQPVTLAGTGVSGPFATIAPQTLVFPPEPAEEAAPPQTVTITNTGTAVLTIGGVNTTNEDFNISQQTCVSGSIPVGQSCTVTIIWTNFADTLPESGQLIIQDNAPNGQQVVALVGGVTVSTVTVAPTSLAFGNQPVNTTSAAKSVVITNTGNANVSVPSIVVPPGYAETDNCKSAGVLVPPNGSGQNNCTINVTFTPTSATGFTGNLTITDSAAGSPHTVALTGTGTASSVTLVSIAVTPNPATVAVNGQVQFTATGTFSDQSTKDITTQSTWTSSDGEVASVGEATGLATGLIVGGPVTIRAFAIGSEISGSAQLTVSNSPITITILPPPGGTFGPVPPGGTLPVGGVITATPGTTGTVTFTCATSSITITCQPRPPSIVLTNNGPTQVAFVVNTFCTGPASSGQNVPIGGVGGGLGLMLLSTILAGAAWTFRRNRRWALSFAVLVLIALGGVACSSLPRGPAGVTPPGDYTLTISATFNGQTVTSAPIHFTVE